MSALSASDSDFMPSEDEDQDERVLVEARDSSDDDYSSSSSSGKNIIFFGFFFSPPSDTHSLLCTQVMTRVAPFSMTNKTP